MANPPRLPAMAVGTKAKYGRVVLKLSGEALLDDREFGISPEYTKYLAEEIRKVRDLGVYDADPRIVRSAKKYDDITYRHLLEKKLGVMDATAAALAEERGLPIIVFDISQPEAMVRAAQGEHIGTLVHANK